MLAVRDIPVPPVGEYDALCEMLYGATCTGTDQHLIAGRFPWPVHYPTIIGHESIGRVIEVGSRVRNFKLGDLVTRVGTPAPRDSGLDVNWGGYAEYGIARDHSAMRDDGLPNSEWGAYRINQVLPPDFDPAAATMIITWRETLSYFSRMCHAMGHRADAPQSLLVVGSGGNGLAVVALVGSPQREQSARSVGATAYYDYHAADTVEQIGNNVAGGFDLIIDAVGKAGQLDAVLPLLKPGGYAGIYGIDDWGKCTLSPARARGTFTFYNGGYDEEETHAEVVALVQQGKLRAADWLDLAHPFALADIDQAFSALHDRKMVKALVRLHE